MTQNFLLANPEDRVKKQIENIYESYSHPWDILAELSQNSVDAIKEWEEEYSDKDQTHSIDIRVEKASNTIEISDTGIGIVPDKLPDLLAPNATDKGGSNSTIGEKGVGLTFCIFCSNGFEIETVSPEGEYESKLKNARTWRERDPTSDIPQTEDESASEVEMDPSKTGTRIRLDDIQLSEENEESIFELSPSRLKYLLRTKTAIGNVKTRYGDDEPDIEVNLTIVKQSGKTFSEEIDFEYHFPHQFWDDEKVVDIEEFEDRDDIGRMSDNQKRKHLSEKVWKCEGTVEKNGQEIRYYAMFTPSAKAWDKISEQQDLVDKDGEGDVSAGVYTSTRGMPTGIEIGTPDTGSRGYWGNTYVLLGYDGFKFDLGRKSIPGRTQGMLKSIAADKFRKFNNWRSIINTNSKTPTPKPVQVSRQQRSERFKELNRLKDINCPGIGFQKVPDGQEAGVVGIFHELVGAGYLDNYRALRSGYRQDYDIWAEYNAAISELGEKMQEQFPEKDQISQEVVIEAKYEAADVLRDIDDGRKYLEDIDMVVSWEIDEERFETSSSTIEPISEENQFYVGVTHELVPSDTSSPVGNQLYVMSIREFIRDKVQ